MSTPTENDKLIAAAVARLKRIEKTEDFDPNRPGSRPNATQQQFFDDLDRHTFRYLRGGNRSGKTQTAAREVAWILTETHPKWKRPTYWGEQKLLILALGQTTQQIRHTMWEKVKAYLEPGTYKENFAGIVLQSVEYLPNGNKIVFISHNNPNEARKNAQSYGAHYVWLDEMPGTAELVEELHKRILDTRGHFVATFTPKVINDKIKRMVDATHEPYGKVYKLHTLLNPIYDEEDKKKIIASFAGLSDTQRQNSLEGDWLVGEEMVYAWDYDKMSRPLPEHYHKGWRHLLSVDPALKSKLGLTLWGEDPESGVWHLILSKYITNVYVPTEIVTTCENLVKGYNICRRVSDVAPFYTETASKMGFVYITIHNKAHRKGELIKGLQQAMGSRINIPAWNEDFIQEITTCRWAEGFQGDKIVNSSSFHLIDSAQYAVDLFPKFEKQQSHRNFYAYLVEADDKRRAKEKMQKNGMSIQKNGIVRVKRGARRGYLLTGR
jgi:hypothetical protein